MSSNLIVHGIRVQNSPQFHFRFDNCRNVTVDAISISSPALSPNTDGIHVENTEMVGIYNSVISSGKSSLFPPSSQICFRFGILRLMISTGDDCISIGAGSINIDIRNVTCGPSHGIRYRQKHFFFSFLDLLCEHESNSIRFLVQHWEPGHEEHSSLRDEHNSKEFSD